MNRYEHISHGILDRIITPCTIDVTDYETTNDTNNRLTVKALWDTGSTVTVLSENVIERLGLFPTDIIKVAGWDAKSIETNTYNVDIMLDDLRVDFVKIVRGPLKNVDMIIGMDIIGQGGLHITHPGLNTALVFNMGK